VKGTRAVFTAYLVVLVAGVAYALVIGWLGR
jgi:hypothetical protein